MAKITYQLKKKINNFPIGFWLTVAEHTYFNGLPFGWRRAEAENYNLIGDPTLAVYGIDYDGQSFAPFHKIKQKDNSQSIEQNNTNPIVRVEVFDVQGRLVLTSSAINEIETKLIYNGVYILKIVYEDGTISTNKLIK